MTHDEAREAYAQVEEAIKNLKPPKYVSMRETPKGDYYLVIRQLGVPVVALQPEKEA